MYFYNVIIKLIWQKDYSKGNCTRRCYCGNRNVTENVGRKKKFKNVKKKIC